MQSGSNSIHGKYLTKRIPGQGGSGPGLNGVMMPDMDDSFISEKQKQSKLEKLEMEINRIMEKNNG